MPVLESQQRAYKKYYEKKKAEGTWKNYSKRVECPICKKTLLNTNKPHHILTKFHNEALKKFISNNQPN
jgi:hypothetical protein